MITVQLADKALSQILEKPMTAELPDVAYFKRPVRLMFKNLLADQPAFKRSLGQQLNAEATPELFEALKEKPLILDVTQEDKLVRILAHQEVDLSDVFPAFFKEPYLLPVTYLDASIGARFKVHHSVFSEREEDSLGLTQLFVLIAYDTLNHLRAPKETVLVSKKALNAAKRKTPARETSLVTTTPIRYFYRKDYRYERIVKQVTNRPIVREPQERFWLKTEWQRKGHWRVIRDKETQAIKKRVWIRPSTVRIQDNAKLHPSITLRISRF